MVVVQARSQYVSRCFPDWCSAWDDPEFVEAVLRLVLTRLVDSQLGIFAMLNFAISIYAVGALTTKVTAHLWE